MAHTGNNVVSCSFVQDPGYVQDDGNTARRDEVKEVVCFQLKVHRYKGEAAHFVFVSLRC